MATDPGDWSRRPGAGAYARRERERRFLVLQAPPPTPPVRHLTDRYVTGTTLRLRHVRVGEDSVYKLTQKVRVGDAHDPAQVSLTTMYLPAAEHQRLSSLLPGPVLTKTRSVHRTSTHAVAVDVFHGPLEGLVLAEIEVQDLDDPVAVPHWVGAEVTRDDRFSGGSLAAADARRIRELLALASSGRTPRG